MPPSQREGSKIITPCILCGLDDAVRFLEEAPAPYRVLQCKRCALDFADPMKTPGPGFYEADDWYTYRASYTPLARTINYYLVGHILRQVRRWLPQERGHLLDVGCGSGEFLALAQRDGWRVSGVDFNPDSVQAARAFLQLGDVHAEPIEKFFARCEDCAQFDLISCLEVLEHLDNPVAVAGMMAAALKPGGRLIISVPDRDRLMFGPRNPTDYPPKHLTRWTPSALRLLLSKHGLRVLKLRTSPVELWPYLTKYVGLGLIRRLFHRAASLEQGETISNRPVHSGQKVRTYGILATYGKIALARSLCFPAERLLTWAGYTGSSLIAMAERPPENEKRANPAFSKAPP